MKVTSTRLVYIQPVLFKTISFHHQSEYFIEFEVKYRQSHMKNSVSAYPSMVNYNPDSGFNKKRIFRPEHENKVQTEKFLILFNDQSITLKGGCNFVIQTDRNVPGNPQSGNQTEAFVVVSLFKQHSVKNSNNQPVPNEKGKLQKVGESTVYINLNILKDYSENSSYRHIMFTKDEYFSSLLFYIDVVHLGMNLRLNNSFRLDEVNKMSKNDLSTKLQKVKNQLKLKSAPSSLRTLLEFKDLRKLYKLLIKDRLKEFQRVVGTYYSAIDIRLQYINNYQIQQPQNIESMDFQKKDFVQLFTRDLSYLQTDQLLDNVDNSYFYSYYDTDDIDDVYNSMFNQSQLINLNVRKVWDRMNMLKLKTLPQEFMNYALKFKIDRMTHVTQLYSSIDESIYCTDSKQMQERIQNHEAERKKLCSTSRFYNLNELKHSMLTFHSEKKENVVSNTSEKNQFQILVVLVHGYQGSQRDMAKIKSFINTFTTINFLPLQTLNKEGNCDILTLGKKGAQEIIKYLQKKPYIQSISMIGFSLGGIIAKAILTNLQAHKSKFNLFMTLSSPHLGISQIQNCLVATGVLWMKKVTRSKNMKQLCCEPLDNKQPDITLVTLSQHSVLDWFNHVVLIGSNEDTYVPKYSALLAYRGSNNIVQEIQKNTLKNIKSMDRLTVRFQYEEGCFDRLTGRKGHISFIEDDTFLEYVIIKYLQFF